MFGQSVQTELPARYSSHGCPAPLLAPSLCQLYSSDRPRSEVQLGLPAPSFPTFAASLQIGSTFKVPDNPVCLCQRSPSSFLFLLLDLAFLLCQFAGADNLGLPDWLFVRKDALWHKHSNCLLVIVILRILARRDILCKPRRALEKHNEEGCSCTGPTEQRPSCPTTPLIENKPNCLLSSEVGVTAVTPQSRGDESPVEIGLPEATWNFTRVLIFLLC